MSRFDSREKARENIRYCTRKPVAKVKQKSSNFSVKASKHPATLLTELLCVKGEWIAGRLGLTHGQYRQSLLSDTAQRQPRTVEPEVSRHLVENWGLDPWDFWQRRQLTSLLQYEVTRAWVAVWNSSDDVLSIKTPAWYGRVKPLLWEDCLAARCAVARERFVWLENKAIAEASEVAAQSRRKEEKTSPPPTAMKKAHAPEKKGNRKAKGGISENLQVYDSERFPLENFVGPIKCGRVLDEHEGFKSLVQELRTACPPRVPSRTELFRIKRDLKLERLRVWCWESRIRP